MQITVIGEYIVDCLEGRLDPRMSKAWRWRPETAVNRNWNDTQGRFGGSNTIRDFHDVQDWVSASLTDSDDVNADING
jgi:sarcosine oxidase/L-pipecolate oxidase